jgi:hypothetical protein
VSRYALAGISAAAAFLIVWFVARICIVLISNAIAKSREDFPPPAVETGPWPVVIAIVSAIAAAYIIMRKR